MASDAAPVLIPWPEVCRLLRWPLYANRIVERQQDYAVTPTPEGLVIEVVEKEP